MREDLELFKDEMVLLVKKLDSIPHEQVLFEICHRQACFLHVVNDRGSADHPDWFGHVDRKSASWGAHGKCLLSRGQNFTGKIVSSLQVQGPENLCGRKNHLTGFRLVFSI